MELNKLHHIIRFLLQSMFILVATAARNELLSVASTTTPEDYWKVNLPNSPIPLFLQDLLTPEPSAGNVHGGKHGATAWSYTGESVHGSRHGKTFWNDNGEKVPGGGNLGTNFNKDLSHQESQLSLIFFKKDLRIGQLMNINFRKTSDMAHFLPRHLSDSIPFSSNNFPQILQKFSLNPHSMEAQVLKATLHGCEVKAVRGEENFCATSLESMVDFSVSKLGKGVIPLSTNTDDPRLKEYRVTGVRKKSGETKELVVCHGLPYAYAVFFCHKTTTAVAYEVDLTMTEDGSKSDAVAICHLDTSEWNSDHVAFRVLGVKPGEVPICHFIEQGNVVWVPAK